MGIGAGALRNTILVSNWSYAATFAAGALVVVVVVIREGRRPDEEQTRDAAISIEGARHHVRIPLVDLVLLPPSRAAAVVFVGAPLTWLTLVALAWAFPAVVGEWVYAFSRAVLT